MYLVSLVNQKTLQYFFNSNSNSISKCCVLIVTKNVEFPLPKFTKPCVSQDILLQ